MISQLRKMSDEVVKYAEVLSQVLKVDIEIVDASLYRVAGTGLYSMSLDLNQSGGAHVIKKVIESGVMGVIEKPRKSELCIGCPQIETCNELFEVCTPIAIGNRVIGAISLVCFTDIQHQHILQNYETFIQFLDQMSELIASKVLENIENEHNIQSVELFNSIINTMDEGVLVLDKESVICKYNSMAKKLLKVDYEMLKSERVNIKETGHEILKTKAYLLEIDDKDYELIGKSYTVSIGNYRKVFVFNDPEAVKENIMVLAKSQDFIGVNKILGHSKEVNDLKEQVLRVASSTSTIYINGESGTGKELLARSLHEDGKGLDKPFVAINCAAIPDNLLESELFGYVKGAFTGADPKGKMGKFELAEDGTLFLDEIGDLPLYIQVKLLRVLEQREFSAVGSNKVLPLKARIIVATNKNLEEMVKLNEFREDLYYRLNVIPLTIPPLRKRDGDIRLLTTHFIKKYCELLSREVHQIEDSFWTAVESYGWPGNVRELQNTIEYIINMMDDQGSIRYELLPEVIKNSSQDLILDSLNIEHMEYQMIKKALLLCSKEDNVKEAAAEKLGIGIATLYRKIKKYEL